MDSSTRMLVLGLLARQPMHGYRITQLVRDGALDRWADVLPGSVYHALRKMTADGLVRIEAEEHTGDRIRTVYAITDSGRDTLKDLVGAALSRPPHDLRSEFALATMWLPILGPPEASELLSQARQAVETARRERSIGRKAKADLPPIVGLLFDNADAIADADQLLLDHIRASVDGSDV